MFKKTFSLILFFLLTACADQIDPTKYKAPQSQARLEKKADAAQSVEVAWVPPISPAKQEENKTTESKTQPERKIVLKMYDDDDTPDVFDREYWKRIDKERKKLQEALDKFKNEDWAKKSEKNKIGSTSAASARTPQKEGSAVTIPAVAVNTSRLRYADEVGKDFKNFQQPEVADLPPGPRYLPWIYQEEKVHNVATGMVNTLSPMASAGSIDESSFSRVVKEAMNNVDNCSSKRSCTIRKMENGPVVIEVLEQLKIIHDFVATYLSYDAVKEGSSYKLGTRSDNNNYIDVLNKRLAVCGGYSLLFVKMCDIVWPGGKTGTECKVVTGKAKAFGYSVDKRQDNDIRHAWVWVKIGASDVYLFDPTWDGGHLDYEKGFVKEYSTDYLFADPKGFIYTHFPSDSKYQVLKNPLTEDEFWNLPNLRMSFFRYGLGLMNASEGLYTNSSNYTLKVYNGAKRDVMFSLNSRALEKPSTSDNVESYNVTFVDPGLNEIKIWLKTPEQRLYSWIGSVHKYYKK